MWQILRDKALQQRKKKKQNTKPRQPKRNFTLLAAWDQIRRENYENTVLPMSKIHKKRKGNSPNHGDQALILWTGVTSYIELWWKDGTGRDGHVPNGRSLWVGAIAGNLWKEIMLGHPYVHVERIHHYYLHCAGSLLTCSSQKLMAKKINLAHWGEWERRNFPLLLAVWKIAVSTLKFVQRGEKKNRGRKKEKKGK